MERPSVILRMSFALDTRTRQISASLSSMLQHSQVNSNATSSSRDTASTCHNKRSRPAVQNNSSLSQQTTHSSKASSKLYHLPPSSLENLTGVYCGFQCILRFFKRGSKCTTRMWIDAAKAKRTRNCVQMTREYVCRLQLYWQAWRKCVKYETAIEHKTLVFITTRIDVSWRSNARVLYPSFD